MGTRPNFSGHDRLRIFSTSLRICFKFSSVHRDRHGKDHNDLCGESFFIILISSFFDIILALALEGQGALAAYQVFRGS
jgi:hypothetical protein